MTIPADLDPVPDQPVISLWAHRPTASFVLGHVRVAYQMLSTDLFQFPLKEAVLQRDLLRVDDLKRLLVAGTAVLARAGVRYDDEAGEEGADDDIADPPADWQWSLTLPDVLTITTAADFVAKAHLGPFGDEMRYMQVDFQHRLAPEEYDARQHELLTYISLFLDEWRELFGRYPAYQQRLEELADLNVYVQ